MPKETFPTETVGTKRKSLSVEKRCLYSYRGEKKAADITSPCIKEWRGKNMERKKKQG